MKLLAILAIIGATALGIYEGDCTAAVIMGLLTIPCFSISKVSRAQRRRVR